MEPAETLPHFPESFLGDTGLNEQGLEKGMCAFAVGGAPLHCPRRGPSAAPEVILGERDGQVVGDARRHPGIIEEEERVPRVEEDRLELHSAKAKQGR